MVCGTVVFMDLMSIGTGDGAQRIAEAFNDYFAAFGIGIRPDDVAAVAAGGRRTIRDSRSGWAITFRVDRAPAGDLSLEFYATNRRTNDRHVRISADGAMEHLDALSEMVILDSASSTGESEARNAAVADRLRERGIYPHS